MGWYLDQSSDTIDNQMKSLTLPAVAVIVFLGVLGLQESHAQQGLELGLRIGDDIAADATMPIGKEPRLHSTVYFDHFGIGAYLDWLFRLSEGPANLRFYPGVGPEMYFDDEFDLAIAGNFGVEWAFSEIPLTVGFDWRPALRLTHDTDFLTKNWGFTARFRFGQSKFEPAD